MDNSTIDDILPVLKVFDAAAWAALSFNFIAIFICVYLCCFKVPFHWTRFKSDTHYRLRCSMSLLLFFNQLIALGRFFVNIMLHTYVEGSSFYKDNFLNLIAPLRAASNVLEWLEIPMLYTVCSLILFLTIDRYERLAMVLKRSWLYFFFSVVRAAVIFALLYIWTVYGWSQLYNAITAKDLAVHPEKPEWHVYRVMMKGYELMLYIILIIGITVDYTVTIRMIWMSVRSGSSSLAASDLKSPGATQNSKAIIRKIIINQQRTFVAVKLISLFLLLWLLDTATGLVMASTTLINGLVNDFDFDMMMGMTTSWLSFRILAVFELMDMLLRELKSANHVNLPSNTYRNGSIAVASSQPDIVSNSLKSWNSDKPTSYSDNNVTHSSFGRSADYSSNTSSTGTNITHSSFNAEYGTTSVVAPVGEAQLMKHQDMVSVYSYSSRAGGYGPPVINHKPREVG